MLFQTVLYIAILQPEYIFSDILASNVPVIEILEESVTGTVIIDDIHRRLQLKQDPASTTLYAAIGNPSSPGVSNLEIKSHRFDGTLQLIVKDGHRGPDREELCGNRSPQPFLQPPPCDTTLVILHGDRRNPSYAKVTLRVVDVNDNAPKFTNANQFELRISEDPGPIESNEHTSIRSAIGRSERPLTKYPLPLSFDPDSGENGIKYYRLTSLTGQDIDGTVFTLVNNKEDDQKNLRFVQSPALKVMGLLDREKTSEYWFHLLAVDGGTPQRTGTLTLHVIITDLNDNPPKFRNPILYFPTIPLISELYGVSNSRENEAIRVPEIVSVGTDILSLIADDEDEGINAELAYRIREPIETEQESHAYQHFQLKRIKDTVTLCTVKPLDADGPQTNLWTDPIRDIFGNLVHLIIEAVDGGSPPLTTSVTLSILIENVNDNPPEIAVQFTNPVSILATRGSQSNKTEVTFGSLHENLMGPNTIAHVTVTDADLSLPATVAARYQQSKSQVHCGTNDTRFVLEQLSSISSQSPTDTPNLVHTSQSLYFYRMSALGSFDREATEIICILITCVDQVTNEYSAYTFSHKNPNPPPSQLTGTATVSIRILDVNDNRPTFTESRYRFSVHETPSFANSFTRTQLLDETPVLVGQVKATDIDANNNGLVRYKLLTNPNEAFKLDTTEGTLWRIGLLDREQSANVELKVEAYDEGSPSLSGTCVILVDIVDLNDHSPYWITNMLDDETNINRWTKSEDGIFYFAISEDIEVGHVVGFIRAVDIDGTVDTGQVNPPSNSLVPAVESLYTTYTENRLTYRLESGEEASVFSINRRTGELRLSRRLDREKRAHYELRAYAVDSPNLDGNKAIDQHGNMKWNQRHTATATIIITVLDVNDNAPQFEAPQVGQEFYIEPDNAMATPGTTLFTAVAHDADSGENATVRYTLDGAGYGLVEIDSTTGVCYIRETLPKHALLKLFDTYRLPVQKVDSTSSEQISELSKNDHYSSEMRSFSLNLVIIAYDMGTPKSLNSSRKVRLVWNGQSQKDASSVYQQHALLQGIFGSGAAYNGKLTRTEHLLIPLIVGAFVLLFIVCCILFGIARYRKQAKHTLLTSPIESDKVQSQSLHHATRQWKWCMCVSPPLDDMCSQTEQMHSNKSDGPIKPWMKNAAPQSTDHSRKSCKTPVKIPERCATSLDHTFSDVQRSYLPDCIPHNELDTSQTLQHTQIGHILVSPSTLHYQWRNRSRYAGATLSRALSEESLYVTKQHEMDYTALCAYPTAQPESTRFDPIRDGTDSEFYNNEHEGSDPQSMFVSKPHPRPTLIRSTAMRPTQVFRAMTQQPSLYSQLSMRNICDASGAPNYSTSQPSGYGLTPTDVESPMYDQFELGATTDFTEPSKSNSNAVTGGWRKKFSSAYAENTFV